MTLLPPRHQRWFRQLVGELDLPAETHATCRACVMLGASSPYSPATKCCTFLPQLPNFLLGALLAEQPERVTPTEAQRRTPMGMLARPEHEARYRAMVADDRFGRDDAMRCPYYVEASGSCGIWGFHEAQCATWFCRHAHGERGRELWAAVRTLLIDVEAALTLWCVRERGFSISAAARDDADAWGLWWGREAEFYTDCAAAVDALDGAALASLVSGSTSAGRDAVVRAHAALGEPSPPAPPGLVVTASLRTRS